MTYILNNDNDVIYNSQPISLPSSTESLLDNIDSTILNDRPSKRTGQCGKFRSVEEIDRKYRHVFTYPYFNSVQSKVIEDALYSDKSVVVSAPTGSGKTVVFEMAIVHLLTELGDKNYTGDFKIIYMAPIKALCTERLTEWYPKFTKLGLNCIEVTGDTNVDFSQLASYRIIITTPEKWDILTRRWRDHRALVDVIKLFLIDEVHILNDEIRGPVLEAVVSRMKTIESSAQSAYRTEQIRRRNQNKDQQPGPFVSSLSPRIRFVAVSATVDNPDDVASWLGTSDKPAVYYKFGDECRPVKLKCIVEGYSCSEGTRTFKFDIILNYKLWPIIQKYYNGKPTLIFCNTRKSVLMTAEVLFREITINFNPEQKAKLTALASTVKNKKVQVLLLNGVGCHHAGLLYEERMNIEQAFRNRDLPILITTTTLAMGVNLPAHLVIIKNTQQYVNGQYQEYPLSTVLQMVGRAGRPQFDTEATAVIMTRTQDKRRYQNLIEGNDPLQSYLHKRLPENLNSEAALGTVTDITQCVQWLYSTFFCVRAAKDPKRYLGLPSNASQHLIKKKMEEMCDKAMNGLASAGLIVMNETCSIQSTEAGRLMSIYYLDLETMKHIMKIQGTESLDQLLSIICDSHELADIHLRMDERRCLNALNRSKTSVTIRFPIKGKINTRQMKLSCIIQAVLGCLPISDPSLNQEAMKIMRIAERICKCLVAFVSRPILVNQQPLYYSGILNSIILAKCITAHLWENSPYMSKQFKGIGPAFSTLLASAGKVNLMLLEESHPRDLERIMNKGPPAGNVLRKQISLLPKYQVTVTPVNEMVVTIKVILLNQIYLVDNLQQLTAGENHISYVIVGDSDNHLLLLKSFRDKDLLNLFDGNITYQVTRKHNFEHKVFVHCLSSNFVGIDAHCEYSFKDLEPIAHPNVNSSVKASTIKDTTKRQAIVTDIYEIHKSKITNSLDVTQSKEKKKPDKAFTEKFKHLKESLEQTSPTLKDDSNKSVEISNKILHDFYIRNNNFFPNKSELKKDCEINQNVNKQSDITVNELDSDEFIDDEEINSILYEIENEISRSSIQDIICDIDLDKNVPVQSTSIKSNSISPTIKKMIEKRSNTTCKLQPINKAKKRKQSDPLCNYKFIDLLEINSNQHENDESVMSTEQTGFTNAVKYQVEKFLCTTKNNIKQSDKFLEQLIKCSKEISPISKQNDKHNISECHTISDDMFNVQEETKTLEKANYFDLPKIDMEEKLTKLCYMKHLRNSNIEKKEAINETCNLTSNQELQIDFRQNNETKVKHLEDIRSTTLSNPSCKLSQKEILSINSTDENVVVQIHNEDHDLNILNSEGVSKLTEISKNNSEMYNLIDNIITADSNYKSQSMTTQSEENNRYCDKIIENVLLNDMSKSQKKIIEDSNEHNETPITQTDCKIEDVTIDSTNHRISVEKGLVPMNYTLNHINCLRNFESSNYINKIQAYHSNTLMPCDRNYDNVINAQVSDYFTNITGKTANNFNDSHHKYIHFEIHENCKKDHSTLIPHISEACSQLSNIPRKATTSNKTTIPCSDGYAKKEHVNKYSYGATNISICSKNMPEHQLHILKKLQVNIDVTEIIMPKKLKMTKDKDRDKLCVKKKNKESIMSPFSWIKRSDNCNVTPAILETSAHIRSVIYKDNEKPFNDNEVIGHSHVMDNKIDEINKTRKKIISRESFSTTNIEKCNPQTSTVESILAKYNKILRKNENTVFFQHESGTKEILNYSNKSFNHERKYQTEIKKLKRPFNIMEIHKIQGKFPKIPVAIKEEELNKSNKLFSHKKQDHSASEELRSLFKFTETNKVKRKSPAVSVSDTNSVLSNITKTEKCNNLISGNDIVNTISNDSDYRKMNEEIPFCQDSVTDYFSQNESSIKDFIDQSMFNPKALLQSVNKDDNHEIIPPPPEFSDVCYSPMSSIQSTDDSNHNETRFQNYNSSTVQYGNNDIDIAMDIDENVFENINAEFTPSKEIQTWTFSRDDESCELQQTNCQFYSQRKPFVFTNPPRCQRSLQSAQLNSRRTKLNYFKFNAKDKLKI